MKKEYIPPELIYIPLDSDIMTSSFYDECDMEIKDGEGEGLLFLDE